MLHRASFLATAALILPVATAHAADGIAPGTRARTPAVAGQAAAAPKAKAAPAGGSLKLKFRKPLLFHKRAFAIIGRPMLVRATLSRYVPGQSVLIRAYRHGHRVMSKRVRLRAKGRRAVATVAFKTRKAGGVKFTAGHLGTRRQHRVYAKSIRLQVHSWNVSFGSTGAVVDLVQRKLRKLHYRAYATGTFDGATGRALLAWRKVNSRARVQYLGRSVLGQLIRDKGAFHARYKRHGRHVEADLSRQVIALINPKGHVYKTFPISSGKPSTPTILGHYRFYLKTIGTNSEGMVDANYFIRGYAIHGYASVPTYPASHGCLRAFIADAAFLYSWIQIGQPIDVYP